jgi:hypothetical protein
VRQPFGVLPTRVFSARLRFVQQPRGSARVVGEGLNHQDASVVCRLCLSNSVRIPKLCHHPAHPSRWNNSPFEIVCQPFYEGFLPRFLGLSLGRRGHLHIRKKRECMGHPGPGHLPNEDYLTRMPAVEWRPGLLGHPTPLRFCLNFAEELR